MDMNQVTLPVSDMSSTVEFYLKMGFTQIVDTPHYARFSCPEGNATFSLSLQQTEFVNGAIIYFESSDLDNLVQNLVNNGIAFEQLPTEEPYLWREAVVIDPSGNKVKLYWAGENRLNPPWKVEKRATAFES